MNMRKRESILNWCLVALAALPVFLFAYLGHFSRMIADDYCVIRKSQELGPWDALHYYFTSWTSSYTRFYVIGLLAPLDTALVSITPVALVFIWCAVLAWVFWLLIRRIQQGRNLWPLWLMLVFALVSASINGLHSIQSFYWFIASTAYIIPIPLFVLCVGIALKAVSWSVLSGRFMLAVLALGAICFINPGFSEMYLVVQCLLLMGMLIGAMLFLSRSLRRPYLIFIGAGWVGTVVSAVIQLNSMGIAVRFNSDIYVRLGTGAPVRTLPDLLARSIGATFEGIGHQEAFAGFTLALAAALYVTLNMYRPRISIEAAGCLTLAAPALWIGLITQLLFVPVLWLHTSDSPHIFDRFSFAYFIIIGVNVIQIIGFVFLLAFRRKTEEFLRDHRGGPVYVAALLLAALALFFLTQARSIHFRAAAFLFISAFVLLCIAWSQLKSSVNMPSKRFLWLPLFVSSLSLICYGSLVALALFSQGFIVGRIFAPVTFIHVLSGAIWGGVLGSLIQRSAMFRQAGGTWVRVYKVASLLVVFAVSIGIVVGQLRMLPRLATFAREWDDRHAEIIRQRDSGSSTIVAPELSYDFGYDLVRWHIFDTAKGGRCSAVYYGVESIIRREDDA